MVEVVYDGNLGNNLFQYCFGRILAQKLNYRLSAGPIKGFPRTYDFIDGKDYKGKNTITLRGQMVDLAFAEKDDPKCHVLVTGYFQRYEYYEYYKKEIKEWLVIEDDINYEVGDNDVVIGIRRGSDYIPRHGLPKSYYEKALSRIQFDKVFICTNEPNDPFVRFFQKKYSAIVRPPGALDNLVFIKKFKKIIISNSTFLWWAAFLSDANEIIFPRPANGFWSINEPGSKNISLEVNEYRYKYQVCEQYTSEFAMERLKNYSTKVVRRIKAAIKRLFPFLNKREVRESKYFFNEDFEG